MTSSVELTIADTHARLALELATGKAQNERIVAAACVCMIAQEGEISLKDFKAANKASLSDRRSGDSLLYKYVSWAGMAYREHVVTWQNKLTRQNDKGADATFAMVLGYLFGDREQGVKGKYRSMNDMVEKLKKPRRERSEDELTDAACERVVKALDPKAEHALTLDHIALVRAALDALELALAETTAERILTDDANGATSTIAPLDNSPERLAAHRAERAAQERADAVAAREAAFAKAS